MLETRRWWSWTYLGAGVEEVEEVEEGVVSTGVAVVDACLAGEGAARAAGAVLLRACAANMVCVGVGGCGWVCW